MNYLKQCPECDTKFPGDLTACTKCGNPEWACNNAPINPIDYVYDIETYPNVFTCYIIHPASGKEWIFEISDRKNEFGLFCDFIFTLKNINARMVGYNNVGFDYPVIHYIINQNVTSPSLIYDKSQLIINSDRNTKWSLMIREQDRLVTQLDLILIWHYNKENEETGTEPTSLKALEVAMRMDNVEDLPFNVGTILTSDEIDTLIRYNRHDVVATTYFYARSQTQIKLREDIEKSLGINVLNDSPTSMGGKILIHECEKKGIKFYEWINGKKYKKQTHRENGIKLSECIFDYIHFDHPEFKRSLEFLKTQTIFQTKGKFENFELPIIDKLEYGFAKGGMHSSVLNEIFISNDDYEIIDIDVASFYPNLAIMNRLHAEHLGDAFCDAYLGVYKTRTSYPKKTSENAVYKEALNANYGNSNNKFSVFLDPKYAMTITVNGQLLICMIADQFVKVPNLKIIQANTDGITCYCPRHYIDHIESVCKWWESLTRLELERVHYSKMFVANVNNYIAVKNDGSVKRIGCYAYERMDENAGTREVPYGKDPSGLVIKKAAEAALVRGEDIETFIRNHDDIYDFMLRAKVPRSNNLVMRFPEFNVDLPLANIVRYYISNTGGNLVKLAPPKGKTGTWKRKNSLTDKYYNDVLASITGTDFENGDIDGVPHDERIHTKSKSKHGACKETGISVGWKVTDCSNVKNFNRETLNYDYYIKEAKKLVEPLLTK